MIAIKDMEMPSCCYECIAKKHCRVGIADGWRTDKRADDCPLIEIEQSEDCVSRQAVINLINEDWKYEGLELSVNELPPVTPTHGTCMDCKHNRPNSYARTMFSCENGHRFKLRDCENFYCADFEKRGAENE